MNHCAPKKDGPIFPPQWACILQTKGCFNSACHDIFLHCLLLVWIPLSTTAVCSLLVRCPLDSHPELWSLGSPNTSSPQSPRTVLGQLDMGGRGLLLFLPWFWQVSQSLFWRPPSTSNYLLHLGLPPLQTSSASSLLQNTSSLHTSAHMLANTDVDVGSVVEVGCLHWQ